MRHWFSVDPVLMTRPQLILDRVIAGVIVAVIYMLIQRACR